jgi:hypothetical protein
MAIFEDLKVKSWTELQKKLFSDSWISCPGVFHSNLIHRGMANWGWPLKTSIQRQNLCARERDLLRNFRKFSRSPGASELGAWELVTIAQHHGLPTRVLDWTYSPLVALHFATEDDKARELDAVVWSVDYAGVHDQLPSDLKRALEDENAAAFTTKMLDDLDVEPFDNIDPTFALIFEPPSIDERVVNQYAGLSVMSQVDADFGDWLKKQRGKLARKLLIPASLKPEIREKLDQSNINERVIYPGLDGIARWLKRYYSVPPRTWK